MGNIKFFMMKMMFLWFLHIFFNNDGTTSKLTLESISITQRTSYKEKNHSK